MSKSDFIEQFPVSDVEDCLINRGIDLSDVDMDSLMRDLQSYCEIHGEYSWGMVEMGIDEEFG